MALNRPISVTYRVKLFATILALVWSIIAVLVFFQYRQERKLRNDIVREQLEMIDSRIIYSYEQGGNMNQTIDYLGSYFSTRLHGDVYISVYNDRDSLLTAVGPPLPLDFSVYDVDRELQVSDNSLQAIVKGYDPKDFFFFSTRKSTDGRITVLTALPWSIAVNETLMVDRSLWIIGLIVTLLATVIAWFMTNYLTTNLNVLRNFAMRAARGDSIADIDSLPHNEIGEISREIITIYEERMRAVEKQDREHRIALHALEDKARIKRQLTNNINHELKTPIGVIRGYLETINDNPDMDEQTRNHFLARTRENVERLCNMLNDLSTMTRLEEGSENIPLGEVNMHDLLFGIENDVRVGHLTGAMEFSFDVPMDCEVLGNHGLINGMIMNLIKNAVIHSHGTEIKLRLISESKKYYVFSFADNGRGVGQEHIHHLFERFYRVDSGRTRNIGGTGLGLPIVKNTVVSMGGTISVHNRSTGGLEFVFSLKKFEK